MVSQQFIHDLSQYTSTRAVYDPHPGQSTEKSIIKVFFKRFSGLIGTLADDIERRGDLLQWHRDDNALWLSRLTRYWFNIGSSDIKGDRACHDAYSAPIDRENLGRSFESFQKDSHTFSEQSIRCLRHIFLPALQPQSFYLLFPAPDRVVSISNGTG